MPTALLILDMQNYFFRTAERQAACPGLVASLNQLIQAFEQSAGAQIYNIVTVHKPDRSTWSRNMLRNNLSCLLEGSHEAAPVAGLLSGPNQVTLIKTRHSAFLRTDLEQQLRAAGVERLVLGGVYLHGCVTLSAIDAWSLDFEVAIAAEAVYSHRPELAEFCAGRLRDMFGMEFLTNEQVVQKWLRQG